MLREALLYQYRIHPWQTRLHPWKFEGQCDHGIQKINVQPLRVLEGSAIGAATQRDASE